MKSNYIRVLCLSVIFFVLEVSFGIIALFSHLWYMYFFVTVIFITLNIFPSIKKRTVHRIKILSDGTDLLSIFLVTLLCEIIYTIFAEMIVFKGFNSAFILHIIMVTVCETIIFWNGIIRVYCSSSMIGAKWRVLGIIFGFIPIAHIIVLVKIISLSYFEVNTENKRELRNEKRKDEKVCATKYPILLIHGVFFRDMDLVNYWGRVPKELEMNGAKIYYGKQQSALSVKESAEEIAKTINEIVAETGCEKVNIIAHSKGGLDCRYAITHLGVDKNVASLTTINTPHKGCIFADWLLENVSV